MSLGGQLVFPDAEQLNLRASSSTDSPPSTGKNGNVAAVRLILAVFISSLIAFLSYKQKSLDLSGGIAGFLVMTIHFTAGFRYGALLLVFFLTSSKLTKVGQDKKKTTR